MKKLLILGTFFVATMMTFLHATDSNCYACGDTPFTYSYEYNTSNIGDTITVNQKKYTIVALPFIEYGTGDHYYIQFPSLSNDADSSDVFSISTSYREETGNKCCCDTFSEYPSMMISRVIYSNSYGVSGGNLSTNTQVYLPFYIKINNTEVTGSLSSTYAYEIGTPSSISEGDNDLTDNLDWTQVDRKNALIESLKILMNHVKIVKIP